MSNISVYCRVRPDGVDNNEDNQRLPMEIKCDNRDQQIHFSLQKKNEDIKIFSFDKIFTEKTTQCEVFDEIKDTLIHSALNGVIFCWIFSF